MSAINVTVGGQSIKLTDNDYLAAGGEGKIYVKGGVVYKIYLDPTAMIPHAKMQELSVLNKPNILRPKDEILDAKTKKPVGFTMDFINGTYALAKAFSNGFRDRNGITPDLSVKLVESMAELIAYIHQCGIIQVDGNELNYLVDETNHILPYFIDVDSYKTKSFPAKVIMPSIRDWHTNDFDTKSDWFSFAIISFQIFIGVHPFKGDHKSFNRTDMVGRMKANVSILNKDVMAPPAMRDLSLIPTNYLDWYKKIFEKGAREAPPSIMGQVISKAQITVVPGSNKFDITQLETFTDVITGCEYMKGIRIAYTTKEVFCGNRAIPLPSKTGGLLFEPTNPGPLFVDVINGKLSIKDINTNQELCTNEIAANRKLIFENRLYVLNDEKLSEVVINMINKGKYLVGLGNSWNILGKSSTVFRGLIYSDAIGSIFLYIPYEHKACAIIRVKELDGYKVIDAKYEGNVAVFMLYKKGIYDRMTIRFAKTLTDPYTVEIENDVTNNSINFVTLENGVSALLADDELTLFTSKSSSKKVVTKCGLVGNLTKDGVTVVLYNGKQLYSAKMRP